MECIASSRPLAPSHRQVTPPLRTVVAYRADNLAHAEASLEGRSCMNELPKGSNGAPPIVVQPIALPEGFLPTWAGPLPGRMFCFGSEDGKWFFTNEHGKSMSGPAKASMSGEAINGVAISGIWMAISTRAEVTFFQMLRDEKGERAG